MAKSINLQELLSSQFAQRVLHPQFWFLTADDLASAAEHLAPKIEEFWKSLESSEESLPLSALSGSRFQHTFMMLYGFAIENLCKGHAVKELSPKEQQTVKRGKLPKRLKTHDLVNLVTKGIGLTIDDHEKELLKRLKKAVKWAGRYPVSADLMDKGKNGIRDILLNMPGGINNDDLQRTRELTNRIRNQVGA